MNLHPIAVHFPIALLTIYGLMELARFNFIQKQTYLFYVKAIFVILGSLATLVALETGDFASEGIDRALDAAKIVRLHETFAKATTVIFGILAVSYLILWLNRENVVRFFNNNRPLIKIWNIFIEVTKFLIETKVVILLALAGLVCITITGGLGGRMVYGSEADPFIKPVLDFLLK